MWVEQIAIENFGAIRRQRITGLGPRVNILFGPNEAGKSTILEFVRSAFFGFRRKSGRLNIYEPPDGLQRSGWLELNTRDGVRLRLSRIERRGQREGGLTVTDDQGIDMQTRLPDLFGNGLTRSAYENLFAFDLDSMCTLDQGALRRKILSAALGSVSVSPLEVLKHIEDRGKRLLKCSPREGSSITSLQGRLRDVDKRLREIRDKPELYLRSKDDLEAVRAQKAAIAEQIRIADESLRKLNEMLRYEEEWRRLVQVSEGAKQLEDVRTFPHDGVSRFEQALERKREVQQGLWEVEQSLSHVRGQVDELHPDEAVLAHGQELGLLTTRAKALAGRQEEIDRVRASILGRQSILREEMASLGAGWSRERVATIDPSIVLEQEIRLVAESWQRGQERIRVLEHGLAEASERSVRAREKVQEIEARLEELTPRGAKYLDPESLSKLQQWKFYRNSVSELREGLTGEDRRMIALTGEHRELSSRLDALRHEKSSIISPVLFWTLMALIGLTGIGVLIVAWDFLGPRTWLYLMIGMCLCSSIPAAVRWKTLWERQRRFQLASEIEAVSRKLALSAREIAHVEQARRTIARKVQAYGSEMARIASDVLGSPSADLSDVLRAEACSSAAEHPVREIRTLESARQAMLEQVQATSLHKQEIESRLQAAKTDIERLTAKWRGWLDEHRLDSNLEPETALSLILRVRAIKGRIYDLEVEERALGELTAVWNEFSRETFALAHSMGKAVEPGASPIELLEEWARTEDESQRIVAEKKALSERIREQELRSGVLLKELYEAEDRIVNLLEAAAATDEESFRRRFVLYQRYQSLEQERRILACSLTAGLGFEDEALMLDGMSGVDWVEIRTAAGDLSDRIQELGQRSEELADRSGRLAHEIACLETETETEMLLNEKEILVAQLNNLAREWMATRLSSVLLRNTLRRYESEKQPKVLEKGSETLAAVSGGTFTKILFPLEGDQVKVKRADGTVMDETLLSRGTLEQVYLILRLAHLEIIQPSEPLPVLLDDVLVNFDRFRAARTAEALVGFSERTGTQVLFFTCHSRIAELFEDTVLRISLEPRRTILDQRDPGTSEQTIH